MPEEVEDPVEEEQEVEKNTYLIRPNFQHKFKGVTVKECIHTVLSEELNDKTYVAEEVPELTKIIANKTEERLKELGYDRYKFVVQVFIGEQRGAGVKMGCRCFWDSDTDNYAQDVYTNSSLFCLAMFNTSSPWVAHGYPTKRLFKHDKILIELGFEQNKREQTSDDPKEFYQRRFLKRTGRRPHKDVGNKLPHVDINDSHGVKQSHVQVQRQNSFDDEYLRYYEEVSASAYNPTPPREAWMDDRNNDANTVSTQTYPDATINSPRSNLRSKRPHSAQIICSKLVTHCPLCRPVSSSSNRPKSATGLLANRNHNQVHICRHIASQRQKEEQLRFSNFIRSCKVFQRPSSAQATKRQHYTISTSEQIHDDFVLQQYTKEESVKHDKMEPGVNEAEQLMVDEEKEDDILYVNEDVCVKQDEEDEAYNEDGEEEETSQGVAVVTDVIITERESIEPEHNDDEKILHESVISHTNQLSDSFGQQVALDKDSPNKEEYPQEADQPEEIETLPEIFELQEDLESSPKTPENSPEVSEKGFDSTTSLPQQKVDIMSGQVVIAPPHEEIITMKLEEDVPDDASQNSNLPDPIAIVTHSYPPIEAVIVVSAREKLKLEKESLNDEDFPSDIRPVPEIPTVQTQEPSDITDLPSNDVELPPSILKKGVASESRRPSEVRFASPDHVTPSESEIDEQEIKTEEDVSEVKEEPSMNKEPLTVEDEEAAMEVVIEKQAPEPVVPNVDLSKSDLVVIGEANVSPTATEPPQVTMDTNQDVVKETKEKEVKVKPAKPKPAAVKPAPEPVVPTYIEPQSLELRKLLAPPDLSDFDVPWPDSPKPKEKKKKKLRGKRGKKKRKKKEAKPPLPPVDPKTFFTYNPNALSSLEMAEEQLAVRPREDPDMREIIDFVQAFNDRFKKEAKSQPWLHGRVALSRQICRFMLPIDLKQLQGLSACEYLQQYCMVCKRRTKLYTMSFEKQINKRKKSRAKDNTEKLLDYKELREAFKDVHVGMVTTAHIDTAFTLANVNKETIVPVDLFCALCALSERTLYSEFITEDTDTNEYAAKELIENADFVGLQSKLEGLDIKEDLKALLLAI